MFDLRKISLFKGLSDEELEVIQQSLRSICFPENQLIIEQGEFSQNLYIVESGELEIFVSNKSGSKFAVATLSSGDYFGEFAFLDDAKRSASVIARSEVKVFEIEKDAFNNILQLYPSVYRVMVKNLIATIREKDANIKELTLKTVYPALKQYLLDQSMLGYSSRKARNTLTAEVIAKQIDAQTGIVANILAFLEDNHFIDIEDNAIYIYKTLPEQID